jgi:hypothetical protein
MVWSSTLRRTAVAPIFAFPPPFDSDASNADGDSTGLLNPGTSRARVFSCLEPE